MGERYSISCVCVCVCVCVCARARAHVPFFIYLFIYQWTPMPGPAQQDGAEERVLWNLRKKVNIKQDTETFILSKGGNRGTQGLRDQEPCLKKPHCFYCAL